MRAGNGYRVFIMYSSSTRTAGKGHSQRGARSKVVSPINSSKLMSALHSKSCRVGLPQLAG